MPMTNIRTLATAGLELGIEFIVGRGNQVGKPGGGGVGLIVYTTVCKTEWTVRVKIIPDGSLLK